MSLSSGEATGRGRPPSPQKRVAIIDAARDLFAEVGYSVSMDSIAEKAGVSKQTIYNCFATKEKLFGEVIACSTEEMLEGLLEPKTAGSVREGLLSIARQYLQMMTSGRIPVVYRLILTTPGALGAELTRLFYDNGPGKGVGRLTGYLRRQAAEGTLAVSDPELAAETFFGMLNGQILVRNILHVQTDWDSDYLAEKSAYCVDMFLNVHAV